MSINTRVDKNEKRFGITFAGATLTLTMASNSFAADKIYGFCSGFLIINALNEISEQYKKDTKVEVVASRVFFERGRQIEQRCPANLFISADQQMDGLCYR
ncbi:hypothetical protein AB6F62_09955 [Providencia huaxiensis]